MHHRLHLNLASVTTSIFAISYTTVLQPDEAFERFQAYHNGPLKLQLEDPALHMHSHTHIRGVISQTLELADQDQRTFCVCDLIQVGRDLVRRWNS